MILYKLKCECGRVNELRLPSDEVAQKATIFLDRLSAWMLTQPESLALNAALYIVTELNELREALETMPMPEERESC